MKWTDKAERGSVAMLRLIAWLARTAGRPFCCFLLYPIVLYFLVTDRTARRASAQFLSLIKQRPAKTREVFQHIYSFAVTLLDRVYMAQGQFERFEVVVENKDLIEQALKQDLGCILLGSHLGSFDFMMLAMRSMDPRPLNIMMRVDPRARLRGIAGIDASMLTLIPSGAPNSLLLAYEALCNGGLLATLADRVEGHSALPVTFLGHRTKMPIAPYVLAARSGSPLLTCFGVYEGANRYRVIFLEAGPTPDPASRGKALQPCVDRYTSILEAQARRYPLNWFNFYPYWDEQELRP